MRVSVGAASDIGQVREGNEDAYLVLDPLFVVADGMGGHRGGEVASDLAVQTIRSLFERREGSLTDQVEEANRAVFERSRSDREVSGMGTTLTALMIDDRRAHLAHVGDSRAYVLRDGELALLTVDHTLVQRMVDEGELTPEQAEGHPQRHILTRVLGGDGSVAVDEGVVELREGDRLLLCTDGLTGMVHDDEIRAVLRRTQDPQEAAERLVRQANQAGGVDNITAIVLDVGDDGAAAARPSSAAVSTATPASPPPTTVQPPPPPPERPGLSPAVRRAAVWTAVGLALVVLGLVGLRLYVDSQWYVGVSDGRVVIFRGIPAEVMGFELSSVVVETTIPAEEAQALAVYQELSDGVTADSREGANEIVEQIRDDVARARTTGT